MKLIRTMSRFLMVEIQFFFFFFDTNDEELMAAETSFKWSKLNFDYNIETTQVFDKFENKELLLLTILHCINYYITIVAAAS